MNKFNKYTTEHLLEMKQEISTIISERETNNEEEVVPRGLNHGKTAVCQNCGTTFSLEDKNAHAMYCSNKCKQSAAYKRSRDKKMNS